MYFLCILQAADRSSFTSRTPNKDQKIGKLFYFILIQVWLARDVHEVRGGYLFARHSLACTLYASHKSWYKLVCLDRFPWFKYRSVELNLLYNISWNEVFLLDCNFTSCAPRGHSTTTTIHYFACDVCFQLCSTYIKHKREYEQGHMLSSSLCTWEFSSSTTYNNKQRSQAAPLQGGRTALLLSHPFTLSYSLYVCIA